MSETPRQNASARRVPDLVLIVVFALAISLPLIGFFAGWNPDAGLKELRVPASAPGWALDSASLRSFPARSEAYFLDHFGFRDHLIRLNNAALMLGLNDSPHTARDRIADAQFHDPLGRFILLGRDRWLFYFPPRVSSDWRGLRPLSRESLRTKMRAFEMRRASLADRGIRYLLVLAPAKHTIYPEFLPANVVRARSRTRMDQIVDALREETTVDFLDLRPALREAKRERRIYQTTGTHWNPMGAYVVYREIVGRTREWFPAQRPKALGFFRIRVLSRPGYEAAQLGLADWLPEDDVELVPKIPRRARLAKSRKLVRYDPAASVPGQVRRIVTGRRELPRAVVFHDSFTVNYVDALLSEEFEKVTYAWRKYEEALTHREDPELVIEQFSEQTIALADPD